MLTYFLPERRGFWGILKASTARRDVRGAAGAKEPLHMTAWQAKSGIISFKNLLLQAGREAENLGDLTVAIIYKQIYWNGSFPKNFCSLPCTNNQESPGMSFPTVGRAMFWSHTVWYSFSCSWLIYELSFSLPVPDNSTWAGSREEQGSCWAPEQQEQMLQRWMGGWAVQWAPDAAPSKPGRPWGTGFPSFWYCGSTWIRSLLLGVCKFTVLFSPITPRGLYFLCHTFLGLGKQERDAPGNWECIAFLKVQT